MSEGHNDRFDFGTPARELASLGRVHFIGIGGAGMSGVARIMLERGVRVSGSDGQNSAGLRALESAGAVVHVGHRAAYLDGVDTVVVSSAIREDNPELAAARRGGIAVLHRAQALAALLVGRRVVAVAGANGKTTTSAMVTTALQHVGAEPSFAIGAQLSGPGVNARGGAGEVFVVEADESDGSFLVYHPEVAIVTNLMPDHLDFYGSLERLTQAYDEFVATIAPGGLLLTCADDDGATRLAARARTAGVRVLTYGVTVGADLRLCDIHGVGFSWEATLVQQGRPDRVLRLGVPGEHNVRDAAGAYLAATAGLGFEPAAVLEGLAGFGGTSRRFEPKGEAGGVRVVDDYAHNAGKVAAAVRTGRGLAGNGRLVIAFQPHLFSRTRDFATELAQGLSQADVVVIMDVYASREDPLPGVSGALVAQQVSGPGVVRYVPAWSDVAPAIVSLVAPGDLVMTVGAGDVTRIGPEVLRLLGQPPPVPCGEGVSAPPGT